MKLKCIVSRAKGGSSVAKAASSTTHDLNFSRAKGGLSVAKAASATTHDLNFSLK